MKWVAKSVDMMAAQLVVGMVVLKVAMMARWLADQLAALTVVLLVDNSVE